MELVLGRRPSTALATIGEVSAEGRHICFTLEDPVRERPGVPVSAWKIKGETAIPAGRYKVIITWSPRFKKDLPLLVRVPGFEGVRIHPGNLPEHTEGCILPGTEVGADGESVRDSRTAYNDLRDLIEGAIEAGEEVWITIQNATHSLQSAGGNDADENPQSI